jgi:tRNA wybutosine-synthesizing protein 4
MLAHFRKLQASIHAIERYLTLEQQSSRFLDSGWSNIDIARNLWDLWSDDAFTPLALRRKLDAVEPFDEWEEFALFGGHYFLLVASNNELRKSTETSAKVTVTADGDVEDTDTKTVLLSWQESVESPLTPRRFTAAFSLDRQTLAFHGGQGSQSRLSDFNVLRRREDRPPPCILQPPRAARMCHTITSISHSEALLVGGRGSPTQALNDCWRIEGGAWTRTDDMAMARYRHCAVAVRSECGGSDIDGVLVFGGKTSDGTVLEEWAFWTAHNGWHSIPVDGPRPSARFGAAMSTMGAKQNSGLLLGGMCEDGTVVEDAWEWSFCATPTTFQLTFVDRSTHIRSPISTTAYARIGASLFPWEDDTLLLIGGVSKNGVHSLAEDFMLLSRSSATIDVRYPAMQFPSTWPLLIGMGVVAPTRNEIVIAGGGAVCFSMGSFWNTGYFTVTNGDMQGVDSWRTLPRPSPRLENGTAQSALATSPNARRKAVTKAVKKYAPSRTVEVLRVRLKSHDDFSRMVVSSKPVIVEGLDIGPCVDLWTLDYLKERIGAERELVVHECASDRMTFKDKNFEYVKKTTSDFLSGIEHGSQMYLRAVSSSQPNKLPTKLEEDFPTIAADFHIPDVFDTVKSNCHSSPLRISGPVSLWLHYDVLSNILCQIRGTKTLYLYPPSDVKYLDYPPGGSSSNTDVLTSKDHKLRFTHPHIASLKPGDILFIPPMWSHTATPEDGVSVAVNVFWKDMDKGYAAGKDVYGNRDLQAYENGRRDVEKIVRAFKELPGDVSRFYLERLAGEILERAEKLGGKGKEKGELEDDVTSRGEQ